MKIIKFFIPLIMTGVSIWLMVVIAIIICDKLDMLNGAGVIAFILAEVGVLFGVLSTGQEVIYRFKKLKKEVIHEI